MHMTGEPDLDGDELAAVHEIELGVEWLLRAQGALLQFHHAVGHAMDHLDDAEGLLRDSHPVLADHLRDDLLPAGVTPEGRWSYELVEAFEEGHLVEAKQFRAHALAELTGGERHVAEQRQQRDWRERARR